MVDSTPDRLRTCEIDYFGPATMEDFFDDLVEVFAAHGLQVDGGSDGPLAEAHERRSAAARLVEAEALLREVRDIGEPDSRLFADIHTDIKRLLSPLVDGEQPHE